MSFGEHGNERLGFHTSWVFIDQMSDCYVLVMQRALWNLLFNHELPRCFFLTSFIWVTAIYVPQYSFIHLVVCLTTGPKPLPKRTLHIVRSRASSFKWEYPLLSLRSTSSFLRLLPRLSVTSIPPCMFPSITRCRKQFLHKMWPIQFAFRSHISCRIFLCSLTLSNTFVFLSWSVVQCLST
jgi:hypothetical protein